MSKSEISITTESPVGVSQTLEINAERCPFTKSDNRPLSDTRTARKPESYAQARRHGWLDMTLTAIKKGWGPEGEGVVAKVKGEGFSRFKVGLRDMVAISDPDALERVLVSNRENYPKGPDYEPLSGIIGLSIFTDDGESWAKHRDWLNPFFNKKFVDALIGKMIEPIEVELAKIDKNPDNHEVDMTGLMTNITIEVVGNALLSQSFLARLPEDFSDQMQVGLQLAGIMSRAFMLVEPPKWLSKIAWRILHSDISLPFSAGEFQNISKSIHGIVHKVINDRRLSPTDDYDVLNLLLNACDNEGLMTPERLQSESVILMMAGHETTTASLFWTWYLLSQNLAARQQMLVEIDTVLQGRTPTLDDLPKLKWTRACLEEGMRIYPPLWGIQRTVANDDELAGQKVKAGETIMLMIWHAHMDPRWWPEPEKYDPNRFMPGAPKRPGLAYLPFGAGRRICIARNFALQEAILILAMYSQRYTFDLVPGSTVEPESGFTLRTKEKMRMIAKRRTDGPALAISARKAHLTLSQVNEMAD